MGYKNKPSGNIRPDLRAVKYVKRAKMWCLTVIANGKQTQEWSLEKPK